VDATRLEDRVEAVHGNAGVADGEALDLPSFYKPTLNQNR
jgi:hypothetical protein